MKAFTFLLAVGAVFAQTPPAQKAPAADNPLMHPANLKAKAPEEFKVKFVTTHGDFVIDVHRSWSPAGADRFYNLVRNKFFTDAGFFRYVKGFIVQFGIPAKPEVAAVWQNANIPDDPPNANNHNRPGTIVFATAGPMTRTTQLFINLGDNSRSLDSQGFTAFGEVSEGMEIVKGLYAEYGEAPDQGRIQAQGKAYLEKNFPKMDFIKSATVEAAPAAAGAPPAQKAAAPVAPKGTAAPATPKSAGAPPVTKK